MRYDAIVIGSGLGGVSCAALLAQGGMKTLLLEKNPRIGGSCSYYEKKGFHVDIGTHMFSRGEKGPIGDVLHRLGCPNAVTFVQTRDIAVLRGLGLDLAVPSQAYRWPAFVVDFIRQARVPLKDIPGIMRFFGAIMAMKPREIEALNGVTVETLVRRYTQNPQMISLFGFLLGLYFILPFWEVSAGEAVWCFQNMVRDRRLSYPVGGSVAIPRAIIAAGQRHGLELLTKAAVRVVHAENGAVTGVECADGRDFQAPIVVSTSSLYDSVYTFVGASQFPETYLERVQAIKGSYIAVQAKIALDRPLLTAGCLVGGVDTSGAYSAQGAWEIPDYRAMFDELTAGRIPPIVPLYGPVPTNFDPSLGPRGAQLITVCTVAPTSDIALEHAPQRWLDGMIRAVEEVVPGLREHLMWIDTLDVSFIENWIGKSGGAAVTSGQTPSQVGIYRPPQRTPLRGYYICGDGAGGRGVGTELAATSGMLCSEMILKERHFGLI